MNKLVFVALLALVAIVAANSAFEEVSKIQFAAFKLKYNKEYKSADEHAMRYKIFKQNLKRVARMNLKTEGANNFGVTKFSDLTPSEFSHMYLMPKRPQPEIKPEQVLEVNYTGVEAPAAWDWRTDGLKGGVSAITAVYNQGQCGSCWAFSATEETESMEFLQGNAGSSPRHLSMQQVVDCDTKAYGCNGGWTYVAYEYIMQAGGYDSLSSYPYTARDGSCKFSPSNIEAKIASWKYVTQSRDENAMKNFVATTGPLSICADAASWQFYNGGVLSTCGNQLDHCIQITGYGAKDGQQAWNVRNSWGADWGEQGYIYLKYGQNTCGLADVVTTVTTK